MVSVLGVFDVFCAIMILALSIFFLSSYSHFYCVYNAFLSLDPLRKGSDT